MREEPSRHYVGPHGCSCTLYCHQRITQTNPRGDRRDLEKAEFSKFSSATKEQQFQVLLIFMFFGVCTEVKRPMAESGV